MTEQISNDRCQFTTAAGKRCRTPRMDLHPALCPHHARQEERDVALDFKLADPTLALDLLGPVHDFRTAASINHVLGKLLVLLTTERISPRNAAVSAYICQLLLQSVRQVEKEVYEVEQCPNRNSPELIETIKRILKAPRLTVSPSDRATSKVSKHVSQLVSHLASQQVSKQVPKQVAHPSSTSANGDSLLPAVSRATT